jgi:tRNA(Arg) A34 adenosine deaminase TadA
MTPEDERFLRRAIGLAAAARSRGEGPFGSLLVGPAGTALVEEMNTVHSDRDISAHPELKIARWAGRELSAEDAAGSTLYTSCEPCGMCAGAIECSGIGRVMFALSDTQLAAVQPRHPSSVRVVGPALFDEARIPLEGYYT